MTQLVYVYFTVFKYSYPMRIHARSSMEMFPYAPHSAHCTVYGIWINLYRPIAIDVTTSFCDEVAIKREDKNYSVYGLPFGKFR